MATQVSKFKDSIYILCAIIFLIIIGGAFYEHITIWPKWGAAPPVSFTMFEGEYGIDPATMWRPVHPLALVLLIVTTVLFWKTPRRKYILPLLIIYIITLITTFTYFVPAVLTILEQGVGTVVDPLLKKETDTWQILSLFRSLTLLPCAFYLLWGLREHK